MLRLSTLLLTIPLSAAVCSKTGTVFTCTDTGDPVQNGVNFQDTLNAATCGEDIILPANVNHDTTTLFTSGLNIFNNPFVLPAKSCNGYITIRSSRLIELPPKLRVSPSDSGKMPKLRSTGTYPAVRVANGARNYRLLGLEFTNTSATDSGCTVIPTTTCTASGYLLSPAENPDDNLPSNIIVDRCLFRPHNPDAVFSSATGGIQWEGRNFTLTNSYIYGFTGWQVNVAGVTQAYHNVTNITSSAVPVITISPGTSSLPGRYDFELGGFTGQYSRLNGFKRCDPMGTNNTCTAPMEPLRNVIIEAGSDPKTVQLITSAPHNLNTGNAVRFTTTWPGLGCLNNNDYTVTRINEYRLTIQANGCSPGGYDDTQGYSSALIISTVGLSGGLGWFRLIERGNLYGFLSVSAPGPITIENNYINAQFVTVFFGGIAGRYNPANRATVVSIQSSSQVTLSHTNNLSVNDAFAIYGADGLWRQGRITGISGNVITFSGIGNRPATGGAPQINGPVQWRGYNVSSVTMRYNTFELLSTRNHMGRKGFIEVKSLVDSLIQGNLFLGEEETQHMFYTARGDWYAPWPTAERITMRDNVFQSGGTTWNLWDGLDGVATQWDIGDKQPNNVYANNLHLSTVIPPFNEVNHGSLYLYHNTWASQSTLARGGYPTSAPNKIVQNNTCGSYPRGIRPFIVLDNIVPYGNSGYFAYGGSGCWELTDTGNVYIDNYSLGTINRPGNQVAASVSAVGFAGACNISNWQNCYLGGSSPYLGSATDGKDPGVDIRELSQQVLQWAPNAKIQVLPGSTRAALSLNLYSPLSSCTLELFTNARRTVLHTDTDIAAERSCTRTGTVFENGRLSIVFGVFSALSLNTTYYYQITDGPRILVGQFTTRGSTTAYTMQVQIGDSTSHNLVVEYADNPAFTGSITTPRVLFSSGKASVSFPVSSAATYWRWRARNSSDVTVRMGRIMVGVQ